MKCKYQQEGLVDLTNKLFREVLSIYLGWYLAYIFVLALMNYSCATAHEFHVIPLFLQRNPR